MLASKVVILAFALFAAATAVKRTVPQVRADIATLKSDLQKFTTDLTSFSGTLSQAFVIQEDATAVDTATKKTTSDVNGTPTISVPDANTILSDVKGLVPVVSTASQQLINKKPQFDSLHVSPIVASGLKNLQTDTQALESAFLAKAPASVAPSAAPVVQAINNALASALAAYS